MEIERKDIDKILKGVDKKGVFVLGIEHSSPESGTGALVFNSREKFVFAESHQECVSHNVLDQFSFDSQGYGSMLSLWVLSSAVEDDMIAYGMIYPEAEEGIVKEKTLFIDNREAPFIIINGVEDLLVFLYPYLDIEGGFDKLVSALDSKRFIAEKED